MALGSRPFLSAKCSEQGYVRGNNEDRVYEDLDRGFFMVVDGMGGQAAGEIAADIAVDRIRLRLERQTDTVERRIREAIAIANNAIYEASQTRDDWKGMACVLTVAIIEGHEVTVGHVGDSRLYKVRKGKIEKLTHDHSPVGEREESGELSEEEAMRHPRRNEVYRDVGSQPRTPDDEQFIEIVQTIFEPDAALLMCSDGLSDVVHSAEVLRIVEENAGDRQATVRKLIEAANQNSKDNVSAVFIEGDDFAESFGYRMKTPAPLQAEAATAPAREPQMDDDEFDRHLKAWRNRGRTSPTPGPAEHESRSVITADSSAARKRGGLWRWQSFVFLAAGIILGLFAAQLLSMLKPVQLPPVPADSGPRHLFVSSLGIQTIAAALEQARQGDVIEISPGEYAEQIHLKDGVDLIAQRVREAIIKPAVLTAGTEAAITAQGIQRCRVVGLSVNGGIEVHDSNVDFQRLEISGAKTAGIEFSGTSRGLLQGSYIHHNSGAGVIVQQKAAPAIENNIVLNNGSAGIKVTSSEPFPMVGNIIADNAAESLWLTHAPDETVLAKNFFTAGASAAKARRFRIIPGAEVHP